MKKSDCINFLVILLLSGTISAFSSTEGKLKTDSLGNINQSIKKAFVTSAKSINRNRAANSAVIGDYIELKVNDLDYIFSSNDTCCLVMKDTLICLSFNGMPHPDLIANSFNRITNSILFHLDRNSKSFKSILQKLSSPMDKTELSNISLCIKGSPPVPTGVTKFILYFTSPQIKLWTLLVIAAILATFIVLARYTSILQIGGEDTRFSLALTQMAFWTMLVSSSVLFIWLTTNNLPELSKSSLALMGISIATTAVSKTLTIYNKNKPLIKPTKKNFLLDIISDNDGVAIHRFQMVLWTVILGIIFALRVYGYQQMPEFSENYLLLMGVSSGAYVLLKTVESRDKTDIKNDTKKPADDSEIPARG